MRTAAEIVDRIAEVESRDMFAAERTGLAHGLSYDDAKPFLAEGVTEEQWAESCVPPDVAIRGYLPFAIGKATDHRGLSASRSIDHMHGWVWLMGDKAYKSIDWENYANYGVPILKACADLVKFDWPDDVRLNRMARGLPCEDFCMEGCGA